MPLDDGSVVVLDAVARERPELSVAGPTGRLAQLCIDKRCQLAAAGGGSPRTPHACGRTR